MRIDGKDFEKLTAYKLKGTKEVLLFIQLPLPNGMQIIPLEDGGKSMGDYRMDYIKRFHDAHYQISWSKIPDSFKEKIRVVSSYIEVNGLPEKLEESVRQSSFFSIKA